MITLCISHLLGNEIKVYSMTYYLFRFLTYGFQVPLSPKSMMELKMKMNVSSPLVGGIASFEIITELSNRTREEPTP
jgi:hypothetical protein